MDRASVIVCFFFALFFFVLCLFGFTDCALFYKEPIFGSKTPYYWARNVTSGVPEDAWSSVSYSGVNCSVFYVDILSRHGARYPTSSWVHDMPNLQKKLIQNNVNSTFIKVWVNPFPEASAGQLSTLGAIEGFEFGKQIASNFKSFAYQMIPNSKFSASRKPRTQDSARNFYFGLTSGLGVNQIHISPAIDNMALRFFENCGKFVNEIEDNRVANAEFYKFLKGPETKKVYADVNSRITQGNFNLTDSEFILID